MTFMIKRQPTRLKVTLALIVFYPVFTAALYALFLFVILPLTTGVSQGVILDPDLNAIVTDSKFFPGPDVQYMGTWTYFYWFMSAFFWSCLLGCILPLMRDTGKEEGRLFDNDDETQHIRLNRVSRISIESVLTNEEREPLNKTLNNVGKESTKNGRIKNTDANESFELKQLSRASTESSVAKEDDPLLVGGSSSDGSIGKYICESPAVDEYLQNAMDIVDGEAKVIGVIEGRKEVLYISKENLASRGEEYGGELGEVDPFLLENAPKKNAYGKLVPKPVLDLVSSFKEETYCSLPSPVSPASNNTVFIYIHNGD